MSCYLGAMGDLVKMRCPATLSRDGGIAPVMWETTTGRRKARLPQNRVRRTWTVKTSPATTPQDAATLEAFALGGLGPGPWWWIAPDAVAANLATPDDSLLLSSTNPQYSPTGPRRGEGVRLPGSVTLTGGTPGPVRVVAPVPVHPDLLPVTVGAFASGTGFMIRIWWVDALGNLTAGPTTPTVSSGVLRRYSVTGTPPAGTVAVAVYVANATVAAGGTVTWTDEEYPYAQGRGCSKAIISEVTDSTTLALVSTPTWGRYSELSYRVTELG